MNATHCRWFTDPPFHFCHLLVSMVEYHCKAMKGMRIPVNHSLYRSTKALTKHWNIKTPWLCFCIMSCRSWCDARCEWSCRVSPLFCMPSADCDLTPHAEVLMWTMTTHKLHSALNSKNRQLVLEVCQMYTPSFLSVSFWLCIGVCSLLVHQEWEASSRGREKF